MYIEGKISRMFVNEQNSGYSNSISILFKAGEITMHPSPRHISKHEFGDRKFWKKKQYFYDYI